MRDEARALHVKICGLREVEHALAAVAAGADLLGFIFAQARRKVSLAQARAMADAVRARPAPPALVGIFVNASAAMINRVADEVGLDYVQLSGDELPGFEREIERPVLRVLRVEREAQPTELLQRAGRYAAARFTLDAGHTAAYGGTGETLDWEVAAGVARALPIILAGGLSPANVGEAVRRVRPWGVDVSSGVETDGVKDVAKIRAFVQAARQAAAEERL